MSEKRPPLEVVVLAVVPTEEDHGQCAAHVRRIEVGRVHAFNVNELAALFAPRTRASKELALCFFR